MRKSNKIDNSFRLLLKQGFRGLFKFKVQFSIILILSFLATLILTISVGTTRHLESNYNQIVKKVPRFSYSATTQIDKTAIENKGGAPIEQYSPVPLVDFANNTSVSALTLADPEEMKVNIINPVVSDVSSNYNFILNDELYRDQFDNPNAATTFISKFMKLDFFNLTQAALNRSPDNTLDDLYKQEVSRSLGWTLIKDIRTYLNLVKNYSLVDTGQPTDPFETETVSYLSETTIAFLAVNQPNFLDFIDNWVIANANHPNRIDPQLFDNLTYAQQQFLDHIYWSSGLFANWLVTEFNRYVQLNEGEVPDITTLYQYFMGKPGDIGYYLKTARNVIHESDDNRYLLVAHPGDATDNDAINEALLSNGYKGITSPLVIGVDETNVIDNVIFTDYYKSLSLNSQPSLAIFNKNLNWSQNFNVVWNPGIDDSDHWNPWEANVVATIYQYHLQLTAMASGYDITFRKESLIFDMISSRKFRYILQNGFDQANFTILEGSMPSAVGEVAISEQFAKANRIKIGDYLAIGQTEVMVVAYGTDAYSFMPLVDTTVPIPEPKTGAFVYGSTQTLQHILHGFGGSSGNQDLTPHYYNYFLTDRKNTWTKTDDKFRLFSNLQMDMANNLGINFANLKNLKPIYYATNYDYIYQIPNDGSEIVIPPKEVAPFWNLQNFNGSPYKTSWTIMPLVLRVLKIVTYISSLVISIIALIALVVCVNKTIMANSKQMGILKALGLNSWKIAFTYLAYGLVIMFIVVPIAWIIGILLEIPFIRLFGTYFSVELLSIHSAWQAFLIAFFGFGILALIVSLVAAYFVLRRPVLEIFNLSIKWSTSRFFDFLKQKKFHQKSFNIRFSLTLASAGIRPIILLTIVIFLTSLLISGSLTIPAIANKAISSYYKSVRYANSYTNMAPTINSPLSKPVINYWEGNEVWDRDWVSSALDLDGTGTKYGYYKDPKGYTDSISQGSVIPRYLYKPEVTSNQQITPAATTNVAYSYFFIASHPSEFLKYVSTIFGDNFFTVLGQSFSIGTIDQFLGLILNSNQETMEQIMGVDYEHSQSLDWNKQQFCFSFIGSLAQGLPNIIGQIIGSVTGSAPPGSGNDNSWKDQIINAILTQVPPYIQNYIYKSPSRTEQFGISFNAETYTPKKESVFTEVLANSANYNGLSLIGLDAGQTAFTIPKSDQTNVFLKWNEIKKIQAILNGNYPGEDISWAGVKLWNQATKTLTVPFLDNKQARSSYHLDKNPTLTEVSALGRQIKYRMKNNGSQPWAVIPSGAWIYDDSDFVTSDVYNDPTQLDPSVVKNNYQVAYQNSQGYFKATNDATNSYLDLYSLDNNKFTYAELYQPTQAATTTLNPSTYMFNDFAVDANLQLTASYVRPYYLYKNIQLYLPLNKINQNDILGSMAKENQGQGVMNDDAHPWFDIIASANVPDSVREAWGDAADTAYLMIRPYDLSYVKDPPSGIERITNGKQAKYWLRYAYDKVMGPGALTYENNEPIKYGVYGRANDLSINLQNVGTLESYDSKLMIIDANIANLLNRYSLARAFGYQNSFFFGDGEVDDDTLPGRPWPDRLVVYPFRDVAQDIYVSKENLADITYLPDYNEANNLAPLRWNNGKYSNIVEPESLTSSVSFNVIDNLGQYSLDLLYPSGLGMTILIKDQTLLSTQRALINQIFTLSISLAALLIIAIVITGSLLIMLMGDIYIAQYQTFMILMRALGYANWEIQTYAFSVVSIFAFIAWVVATIVAWAIVFGVIHRMSNQGLAIPYGLSWWPIVVSLIIIVVSFLGSLWVSSYKVRHDPVSLLMSDN